MAYERGGKLYSLSGKRDGKIKNCLILHDICKYG